MARRYRRKARRQKPRRRLPRRSITRVVKVAVAVAILGWIGLGFYGFASEEYPVKAIRVDGTRVLEEEYVIAVSGITNADNLLSLDVGAIQERVEALPYVRTCTVTRIHPDNVVITLEEREAVATLLVHNRSFEIDADCVVLRELFRGELYPGPFVTGVPGLGSIEVGQQVGRLPLQAALAVWDAFRRTKMAEDLTVSEIVARGVNDIRMYCDELPFEIRWGRNEFEKQARRLDILWDEMDKTLDCREYLDLRFGNDLACL